MKSLKEKQIHFILNMTSFSIKKMEIICKKGDVQAAYDSLLCSTGKVPTLNKINALYLYGSKLGKIKLNVIEDLKRILQYLRGPVTHSKENYIIETIHCH